MRLAKAILFYAVVLLIPSLAWGIEDDQLRGVVVGVNEDARTLTLRVLESGENIHLAEDTVKTFKVPESANVKDRINSRSITMPSDIIANLGDIDKDDTVRVELDVNNPSLLILIHTE